MIVTSQRVANGTPTGVAKLNRCQQLKFVSSDINFQVNQDGSNVVVQAHTIPSIPSSQVTILQVSPQGQGYTIVGRASPYAQVALTSNGVQVATTRSGTTGYFRFTNIPRSQQEYTITDGSGIVQFNLMWRPGQQYHYDITFTDYAYYSPTDWFIQGYGEYAEGSTLGPYDNKLVTDYGSYLNSPSETTYFELRGTYYDDDGGPYIMELLPGTHDFHQFNNRVIGIQRSRHYDIIIGTDNSIEIRES